MAQKPLQIHPTLNIPVEVEAITSSAGAGDAGKIVATGGDGKLDPSIVPSQDTAEVIQTSEALSAGDFVNIYVDSGSRKVRLADASAADADKIAHGFVLDNVIANDDATVYTDRLNSALTGLTPGASYVLSHTSPGGAVIQSSGPTTAGQSLQVLGVAVSTTAIDFQFYSPILRG